ncbi:hypothetical protein [Reyranella sp.]|uniref:hypothetical protein n=1 Tax=Reyranella sp. TaxID=1929291 RepID=UPI002731149A|nr:hypothetical protein [Reyranella sp.]MDP2377119.1 hypothetical protein [Reyranella sp.]
MNRTLISYQIPGGTSFAERITGLTWSAPDLWYTRGDVMRVGRLSPSDGSYKEYQIKFPAPQNRDLGDLAAMRRFGRQRSARLAVAARRTRGLVMFDESPLAARLFELGGYKKRPDHDLVVSPNLVAVARNNSPWISALVRLASANPSNGHDSAMIQFSLGASSGPHAKVLRLSPTAGVVASIWFDATNRPWVAFGQGNSRIISPYIFGVMLGNSEVACYETPDPVADYRSVTGHDAASTVRGVHSARGEIVSAPNIGIPFVGPSSFRDIQFHHLPGLEIQRLASNTAGDVWFSATRGSAGGAVGVLDHSAPARDGMQTTAIHERLSQLPNDVIVSELKVSQVASGLATIGRHVVAGTVGASGAFNYWNTPHPVSFLTTGRTTPWFAFSQERMIATLEN